MSQVDTGAVKRNAVILANAAALTSAIITAMTNTGKNSDISRTINNESLSRDKIEHLVLQKMTNGIVA